MKALVNTAANSLTYMDYSEPVLKFGEELVRVLYSGICGSDMHAYLGHDPRRPTPLILGHEASGTIVGGPRDGASVAINPLNGCGNCASCIVGRSNICSERQIISMPPRPGAFAELVSIPSENLLDVPSPSLLKVAALTEPLACGWHAVRLGLRLQDTPVSDLKCVVLGGGAIGVGAALCLRAMGVQDITVIEVNSLRLETLHGIVGFKASDGFDASAPLPSSANLVIDGVGFVATRASACELTKPGGVICHIGLGSADGGVDVRRLTLQEITFIGTYTYTPQDFRDTGAAIFAGQLGSLDWIESRPLSEGQAAFEDIRNGRTSAPKIILIP